MAQVTSITTTFPALVLPVVVASSHCQMNPTNVRTAQLATCVSVQPVQGILSHWRNTTATHAPKATTVQSDHMNQKSAQPATTQRYKEPSRSMDAFLARLTSTTTSRARLVAGSVVQHRHRKATLRHVSAMAGTEHSSRVSVLVYAPRASNPRTTSLTSTRLRTVKPSSRVSAHLIRRSTTSATVSQKLKRLLSARSNVQELMDR